MKVFAITPVFVALLACGVTETGNPVEVDLELQARSTAPEQVDVQAPAGITSVTQAWLAVDRIRFVRGDVCDGPGEEEFDLEGPFVRDSAAPIPEALRATLVEGDYCRVRMRLEPAVDAGGAPGDLIGHVVLVSGVRADGVPWQLRSNTEVDADVRSVEPIPLTEATASLEVALDVATWLDGVDLNAATPVDGLIRIEPGANDALLQAFEANFEASLELFDID
jgi:hypothetical protein